MVRSIQSKIYKLEDLVDTLQKENGQGKKIGLTNGTFDLLHAGHVIYLETAKKMCDILIVSLNTDASVKKYKDKRRPIVSQTDRAFVVAAIESVDFVTFHSERRMKKTLELLRPNYYIKGGDYTHSRLTSSSVLKKWGGEVEILPYVQGKSTSNILNDILKAYDVTPIMLKNNTVKEKTKAVILDRDGVINEEVEYLHESEKFRFTKYALLGLRQIQDMGFKIVIATTQAGIGLGYFTKEDFFNVNKVMLNGFRNHGVVASKVYFCPHTVSDNCSCRKPKTGLIERAKQDLNIDLYRSWAIGDKTADILAGKKVGCRTILVFSGHAGADREFSVKPDFVAKDLREAADIIKKNS